MPELIDEEEIEGQTFSKFARIIVPRPSRHYIDDNHLTQIMSDWKKEYDKAKSEGRETPRLPEAVGEAIFDMSEAMGRRHNFSGYSYLDEMKNDAILHCVKYIHNFNPGKLSKKKGKVSAFGYINMIIWRSFSNRIKFEKKEQYLKYKSFELMGGMDAFQDDDLMVMSGDDGDDGMSIGVLGADFIQKAREYEEKYLDKGVKKEKTVQFDDFMFQLTESNDNESVEELPDDVDLSLGDDLNMEFDNE